MFCLAVKFKGLQFVNSDSFPYDESYHFWLVKKYLSLLHEGLFDRIVWSCRIENVPLYFGMCSGETNCKFHSFEHKTCRKQVQLACLLTVELWFNLKFTVWMSP